MSMAIKYAMKKRMAKGGPVGKESRSEYDPYKGSGVHPSGSSDHPGESIAGDMVRRGHPGGKTMHRDRLKDLKAMRGQDRTNLAEGGTVHEKLDYTELKPGDRKGQSRAGVYVREAARQRGFGDHDSMERAKRSEGYAKKEHHAVIHDLKNDKKDRTNMAEGGLVDRIMAKRGGYEEPLADFECNDFDELDLEPAPEADYPGSNEHGNAELEEDDHDLVARIMRSRSKKDRMPRPA